MQMQTGRGAILTFAFGFILVWGFLAPTPAQEEAVTPDPPAIARAGLSGGSGIPSDVQIYCTREHTVRDQSGELVGLETEGPYGEFSRVEIGASKPWE